MHATWASKLFFFRKGTPVFFRKSMKLKHFFNQLRKSHLRVHYTERVLLNWIIYTCIFMILGLGWYISVSVHHNIFSNDLSGIFLPRMNYHPFLTEGEKLSLRFDLNTSWWVVQSHAIWAYLSENVFQKSKIHSHYTFLASKSTYIWIFCL